VISHVKYAFAAQLSTADRTAYTAASFLALTGELGSINSYFALYDKVTSADVKRVAQTYFVPTNRTTVTLKAGK
jgi:predicted Zn-dependent peptidase